MAIANCLAGDVDLLALKSLCGCGKSNQQAGGQEPERGGEQAVGMGKDHGYLSYSQCLHFSAVPGPRLAQPRSVGPIRGARGQPRRPVQWLRRTAARRILAWLAAFRGPQRVPASWTVDEGHRVAMAATD